MADSQELPLAWKQADVIAKMLVPILVFGIAYYLINSVETSIKEQNLTLESSKQIGDPIRKLLTGCSTPAGQTCIGLAPEERASIEIYLGSLGATAIVPLLRALPEFDSGDAKESVKEAIEHATILAPKASCDALRNALTVHASLYSHDAMVVVIQVAGRARCDRATTGLSRLRRYLESVECSNRICEFYDGKVPEDIIDTLKCEVAVAKHRIKANWSQVRECRPSQQGGV